MNVVLGRKIGDNYEFGSIFKSIAEYYKRWKIGKKLNLITSVNLWKLFSYFSGVYNILFKISIKSRLNLKLQKEPSRRWRQSMASVGTLPVENLTIALFLWFCDRPNWTSHLWPLFSVKPFYNNALPSVK